MEVFAYLNGKVLPISAAFNGRKVPYRGGKFWLYSVIARELQIGSFCVVI
jgi:hypothetical protein